MKKVRYLARFTKCATVTPRSRTHPFRVCSPNLYLIGTTNSVQIVGLEPTCPFEHLLLRQARRPIPAYLHKYPEWDSNPQCINVLVPKTSASHQFRHPGRIPPVGIEPTSLGKIQGSNIELKR